MSAVALREPKSVAERPKAGRRTRIPPRIAEAIRLITTGEVTTQKAAAERVGLNATYLCEALKKPNVQVFIEHETRKTIAAGLMRAGARLNQLMDASSEHVSLDATKHVLGIASIRPPDNSQPLVNIAITPGYVVKLRHVEDQASEVHVAPAHEPSVDGSMG